MALMGMLRTIRKGGIRGAGRRSRAFTLVELIVAVGAVALLTVGVGRIFESVGSLVSTGSAIAEVEQLARAIESQMRQDFEALNRMRADEVFLAIRCRRVGDIDLDGEVDSSGFTNSTGYERERALYLTPEDREFDLRNGLLPYEDGSRAVTRRLDEIMFLGFGGDGGLYHSFTPTCDTDPFGTTPCETCVRDVSADTARIYYGHGLRPAIDLSGFSSGVDSDGRYWRSYFPDGDFGAPAGSENRFDPAGEVNNGAVSGRNEYAGDWPLLRHAMLLYGGGAAGPSGSLSGSAISGEAVICNGRDFSPYIRDLENMQRMSMHASNAYRNAQSWAIANQDFVGPTVAGEFWAPTDAARPRPFMYGRTDICAQSPRDVQRWLEGLSTQAATGVADASAFSSGRFQDPADPEGAVGVSEDGNPYDYDRPLWTYGGGPNPPNNTTEVTTGIDLGVFSAIAGCFSRIQCETEPPAVNRGDDSNPEVLCGSVMDSHAVFATRCSNFEVAWSEPQARWRNNINEPVGNAFGEGVIDPRTEERVEALEIEDIIWFDYDLPRQVFVWMTQFGVLPGVDINTFRAMDEFPSFKDESDPEFLSPVLGILDSVPFTPPFNRNLWLTPSLANDDDQFPGIPPQTFGYMGYDWRMTGGDFAEYKAIFPYRVPNIGLGRGTTADDGYSNVAFPKPQFIRVRMTLHDSQMRLKDGKDFEFIFNLDLQ